ncbi:sensor histidine kinase [Lederbergia sp. NSJ-179]|uniref:sensor histidine kinase n=1 Tax=Lederbergia sp. NSJ-179 TaxID=2931402 RepID=UPI001FCFFEFD|nr:sensor histidine kinase [Lederbergia sp. NSJ-179]MCJ7842526.1 sensor histidine kinase [Lederbergia sp. NSJ-179]
MIRKFFIERCSWILLFLFVQGLALFIAYIDPTIPFTPILYIVFLSCLIFIVFVMIRYYKETKFYKSLEEWEKDLDLTNIASAESPFEKIVEENIIDQTERLKKQASQNSMIVEQEKDDLLSWIHEVKTPLTAMHLIIDRLGDNKMKAQLTHEWLRIHLLLDQQLHQRRISFIENDLHIEKADVKSIIFAEIKSLQSWCMQKGIGFNVDLEVTEVLSDSKWLSFIIRQLLTNAIKYSQSSDIMIKTYQQNEQTNLEITDFGRGIASKDLPRIFDKGFTTTSEKQENAATGMGLYLAKKAAQPLLIDIHVNSKTAIGTTFTLTFPKRNDFHYIAGM